MANPNVTIRNFCIDAGGPALANTAAETGACVISKCQSELARCITDEKCLESLVCLNSCETAPNKSGCQVRSSRGS